MTFEEFVLSLGYTKRGIAQMTTSQIRFLEERWFKQREGKE